jgi:PAS domain S-box-containing protein
MIGSAREQNKTRKMHPLVHGNCLPMWIYDRRTLRFLEVSEGAIRLYGYSREEFLKMTIREIGPPEETTKLAHLDPGAVNGNHR